ncbi:TIM barrel protein [Shimia sp. SDUM112013]
MLFKEYPFLERFAAARRAGFEAVEILFPYDISARDILKASESAKIPIILINTPPPNWAGGDRGFAAIPGGQDRFRHDFKRALRYAEVLGAKMVHIMSGVADGPEAMATMIDNLAWATDWAPKQLLTIEPINPLDIPGYFLNDFDLAADILDAVAAPNLALQFDAYHAQRITGDVIGTWQAHRPRIGHVQVADTPRRHEPGTGEINFAEFFSQLDADGYQGHVSAEYHPKQSTEAGLGWLKRS